MYARPFPVALIAALSFAQAHAADGMPPVRRAARPKRRSR